MKDLLTYIYESRDKMADDRLQKKFDALRKEYIIKNIHRMGEAEAFSWIGASMKIAKQIFTLMKNEEIPSDIAASWFKYSYSEMILVSNAGNEDFDPSDMDDLGWDKADKQHIKFYKELCDEVEECEENRLNIKGSNSYFAMLFPVEYQDAYKTFIKKNKKEDKTEDIYNKFVEIWKSLFDYELK